MSDNTESKADYKVQGDGKLRRTAALDALSERIRELRQAERLLDAAYCGAVIASVFRENDWLESFQIDLYPSIESGDAGDSYRTVSLAVSNTVAREGMPVPEDLLDDGAFSDERGDEHLETALEDDDSAIYCALVDEDEFMDLTFVFERKELSDLLGEPEIGGRDAFLRLFKDYAHRITPLADRY